MPPPLQNYDDKIIIKEVVVRSRRVYSDTGLLSLFLLRALLSNVIDARCVWLFKFTLNEI